MWNIINMLTKFPSEEANPKIESYELIQSLKVYSDLLKERRHFVSVKLKTMQRIWAKCFLSTGILAIFNTN
jgi:hypothetical protein